MAVSSRCTVFHLPAACAYQVETALADLELKERSGELVARDAIEREWFRLARQTRDNFLNLPTRCAALVAAERNQDRCHNILAGEIRQILEGFAQWLDNGNGADVRPVPPPRRKDPPPPRS